jgi:ComF family protein
MRHIVDQLLRFFFPDRCVGCKALGDLVCSHCIAGLRPYPEIVRRMPETLAQVRVGFVFDGVLRQAVHQLKYRKMRRIAQPLAAILAAELQARLPEADAVLAVPLHPKRLAQRGYNQAEEIARALARHWNLPHIIGIARVRTTEKQALLDTHARAANVRGAFQWVHPEPPPRRVLLVDDVLTTGATMAACAEALLLAGSDLVYGIALARSRPDLDRG